MDTCCNYSPRKPFPFRVVRSPEDRLLLPRELVAGPLVGRAPKASRHAPKAADTPGREEAMLPPSKPSSKSRGKVQKTFGRKQPAAGRAGAASPEALDVFGGM